MMGECCLSWKNEFTDVLRVSEINRHSLYEKMLIKMGYSVGENATVVCGIAIGIYAFIAAGSVVTKDVPDYGLIVGVPGKLAGFMSRHGIKLNFDKDGIAICPESGLRYKKDGDRVYCLDLNEEDELPENMKTGKTEYRGFKK